MDFFLPDRMSENSFVAVGLCPPRSPYPPNFRKCPQTIALATAPAPAVSIVNEFHAKGPVTDTLLPMTVLDDVVGIAVFFTVNSLIARAASGGAVPMYMIPVMIFLPILIGAAVGFPTGLLLKNVKGKVGNLTVLLCGITVTMLIGWLLNTYLLSGIALNYTLMGVAFSAVYANRIPPEQVEEINEFIAVIAAKKGFELAGEIKKA